MPMSLPRQRFSAWHIACERPLARETELLENARRALGRLPRYNATA